MKIAVSVSEKEKVKGPDSPYFVVLVRAGAKPGEVRLVTLAGSEHLRAEDFDGILFAGGEDVDPTFYEEAKRYDNVHVNRQRDAFEFHWLDRARRGNLPVLGICRGAQMVNTRFGGTLYQDIENDLPRLEVNHRQPGGRSELTHSVTVTDPDSRLAQVFQGSERVNSLHHQAIRRVGHGLKVSARSEDGLVEAVELAGDGPYLLAVQWHPEELAEQPLQLRLFEQFLEECRATASRRATKSRTTA
ncbi:MAG: gamma-glutamyl-gamma-aminobutyrate hydrolase family protein [Terriglobia bacterium]